MTPRPPIPSLDAVAWRQALIRREMQWLLNEPTAEALKVVILAVGPDMPLTFIADGREAQA